MSIQRPGLSENERHELEDMIRVARRQGPSHATVVRMGEWLAAEKLTGSADLPSAPLDMADDGRSERSSSSSLKLLAGTVLAMMGGVLLASNYLYRAHLASRDGFSSLLSASESAPVVDAHEVLVPALPLSTTAFSEEAAATISPLKTSHPSSVGSHNLGHVEDGNELSLIERAKTALISDPRKALAIADEHARHFPRGELIQEREVITVEALSRLGKSEEAKKRARALISRFPKSPYTATLERAIGEPLTNAH